jgi:hydroxyquinol 1,2-dioxygenase
MAQLQFEGKDIAQAVIGRMDECKDPRFKQVMTSLIKHMHAFAQDVDLKPDEWMNAIEFLTACGKMCDEKRQEFILLSDTLGLSMLVVALDQARGAAALKANPPKLMPTEATVLGPFFWEGAPELPLGADISEGQSGEPCYYHGQVTDTAGKPLAGAIIDVWSGDGEGFYDMQKGDGNTMALRARFRTDANGHYHYWSIKPAYYPVPDDGPVGGMLRRMGRHPNRPGHMHTMLQATGHERLVTHIFVSDSPYIESDAVFGVRESLIATFKSHPSGKAPDGREMKTTFHSALYDFRLVPTSQAA